MYDEETGEWHEWTGNSDDEFYEDVDDYIATLVNFNEFAKFTEDLMMQLL